jgi:hypothetical protein
LHALHWDQKKEKEKRRKKDMERKRDDLMLRVKKKDME